MRALVVTGCNAEWEALFLQSVASGSATMVVSTARTEAYGRGEYLAPTPGEISYTSALLRALDKFEPDWWLPDSLDRFARDVLADAVASVLRP